MEQEKDVNAKTAVPKKESVLEEAQRVVGGARQGHYGPPEENQPRVAELWSAYLGLPLSARQVCDMIILMKLGRSSTGGRYYRDTYVDIAGYALCVERCHDAGVADPPTTRA